MPFTPHSLCQRWLHDLVQIVTNDFKTELQEENHWLLYAPIPVVLERLENERTFWEAFTLLTHRACPLAIERVRLNVSEGEIDNSERFDEG